MICAEQVRVVEMKKSCAVITRFKTRGILLLLYFAAFRSLWLRAASSAMIGCIGDALHV